MTRWRAGCADCELQDFVKILLRNWSGHNLYYHYMTRSAFGKDDDVGEGGAAKWLRMFLLTPVEKTSDGIETSLGA